MAPPDFRKRNDRREALRFFVCGDVMIGRGIDQILPAPVEPVLQESYVGSALTYVELAERKNGPIPRGAEPHYVWGEAIDEWQQMGPDLRLVNLETSLTRSADFAPKGINYRASPENGACLAAASIDACCVANNHVLDFGRAGLADTVATLRRLGIAAAGAGANLAGAQSAVAIPVPGTGIRVILVAAAFEDSGVPRGWRAGPHAPGVNLVEPGIQAAETLAERIAGVRKPGDLGIVSIHWGSNWGYEVPEAHRRFAHALVDSGQVAVVHGHSSHHPRPVEVYRNHLILYGCGDFLNDYEGIRGHEAFRSWLAGMYFVDLDREGRLLGLALTPMTIRRFRLERAAAEEVAWLRAVLSHESGSFGLRFVPMEGERLRAVPIPS